VDALSRAGIGTVRTREPGGSTGAELVRDLLLKGDAERGDVIAEALLISAARRDHLVKTIWPALDRGDWVVCDRFSDSTLAYQGFGEGLDVAALRALYALVAPGFAPDLTLILDLPVDVGLARAAARLAGAAADRFERRPRAFHERLRDGFLEIARHETQRCAVLDASVGVEATFAAIRREVETRLGIRLAAG
jgi:dTMP kinase